MTATSMTPTSPDEPPQTRVVGTSSNFWLFNPSTGWDLTHPPSAEAPASVTIPRLTLLTNTSPVTIDPAKTALIIIDMQNYFLSPAMGASSAGAGHAAEAVLLSMGIPAARTAGIQIVHVTWGFSEADLLVVPPSNWRVNGFHAHPDGSESYKGRQYGDDIGPVTLPDGSTVQAGRQFMRGQWNMDLHEPLKRDFEASQRTDRPDVLVHKNRTSGFWGGDTETLRYLRGRGFTTLLFAGVNTDQCVLASILDCCFLGFDCIMLEDGCGTTSPEHATKTVIYNVGHAYGFVSSCKALADGVDKME